MQNVDETYKRIIAEHRARRDGEASEPFEVELFALWGDSREIERFRFSSLREMEGFCRGAWSAAQAGVGCADYLLTLDEDEAQRTLTRRRLGFSRIQ